MLVANASVPAHAEDIREWNAATEGEMQKSRGGYVTEGGLQFTLGIEKAVYINGELVATNSLNILNDGTGIPRLAPGQTLGPTFTLVQNGPGNVFTPIDPGALHSGFFTVVQNSLDQQVIRNIDRISTTISVMGLFREISQASALNQQLIHSLR